MNVNMNLNDCLRVLGFTLLTFTLGTGVSCAELESNEGEPIYLQTNGVFRPVQVRGSTVEEATLYLTKMISGAELKVDGRIPRQVLIPYLTYGDS